MAGSRSDSRLSPKIAVAWSLGDMVELYGNWGRGFHSNDARGVVNPDPQLKVPGLVPGTGREGVIEGLAIDILGVRWEVPLNRFRQVLVDAIGHGGIFYNPRRATT